MLPAKLHSLFEAVFGEAVHVEKAYPAILWLPGNSAPCLAEHAYLETKDGRTFRMAWSDDYAEIAAPRNHTLRFHWK